MTDAPSREILYRPLDYFVVRAPLLPIEAYASADSARFHELDLDVRRALAVASPAAFDAFLAGKEPRGARRRRRLNRTLSRYVNRMSTRPTPFGLFAGVALGHWHDHTGLRLSTAPRRTRTRPDAGWLMNLVIRLESVSAIRHRLRLVVNPAALVRAGRIVLSERMPIGDGSIPPAVSIRATAAARLALTAARTPLPHAQLMATLLEQIDGATPEKVERLITELWQQSFLLTELRPPLTGQNAVRHVLDTLDGIVEAAPSCAQLRAVTDEAAEWDESPRECAADRFREMVASAKSVVQCDGSPFQIDSSFDLVADTLTQGVADEVCRAAQILLRLSPQPHGPAHLASYRRAFWRRYGPGREVPLLELVDPEIGLGNPWIGHYGTAMPADAGRALRRRETLAAIATQALRDRQHVVVLDDTVLARLELADLSAGEPPASLELAVSVAAESRDSIDAGNFQVVISPSIGSQAAGRTLGRFADLVPGATTALESAARAEQALRPDLIWAELVFQPHAFRLGNVSIRPNVRPYEIVLGVSPGRPLDRTIPLSELVIGVREDRFYIRWPARDREVAVIATHMLTHRRAPAPARALFELSLDRRCPLTAFQWESVSRFPFLPRVQVGRIVLSLARWRMVRDRLPDGAVRDPVLFARWFERWCTEWQVPRCVYLHYGEQRLLLDLTIPGHVEEMRFQLASLSESGAIVITEVLPDLDQAWTSDADGRHFMTEFVVPLVRRRVSERERRRVASAQVRTASQPCSVITSEIAEESSAQEWMRPPGSDWLFAKLYCVKSIENQFIAGSLRRFADRACTSGLASKWFFLRYADPDRHLRLRFNGSAHRLWTELFPSLCAWASELVDRRLCTRFAFDTYDREIHRYGGEAAMAAVEAWFAEDSSVVADCLDLLSVSRAVPVLPVAVLTVDALLDGLGLDAASRAHWCRQHVSSRKIAGDEYRQWKATLRYVLAGGKLQAPRFAVADVVRILDRVRVAGNALRQELGVLESRGALTRPYAQLIASFVHLHVNRISGEGASEEERILGLLWRVREGLRKTTPTTRT